MAYTTIDKGSDYFNTLLYSGNSTSGTSITGVGFQPDFTWIKGRTNADSHALTDAVRTAGYTIFSDLTNAEQDPATSGNDKIQSFDSDGFTLGANGMVNGSSYTYASWNWKANGSGSSNTDGSITSTVSVSTTSGFSIVKWTGDGSASGAKTVGHGLGATPKFVIAKKTSAAATWWVGIDINGWNWNTDYLELNSTNAKQSDASGSVFYSAPTSSLINLGSELNASSANYIAYCFAEKKGFSKFGSYTGNGSADGTFVYTGFKPAMVIIKKSSNAGSNWIIGDNKRSAYNLVQAELYPNNSTAEDTAAPIGDLLSNGFKIRSTSTAKNASGATFIYMAFAEHPLVSSTGVPCTAR